LEGRLPDFLVIVATTHGSEFIFLSLFVRLRLISLRFGLHFATSFAPSPISPALDDPTIPLSLSIQCGFLGSELPGEKQIFLAS
jgi:hypothetical protein